MSAHGTPRDASSVASPTFTRFGNSLALSPKLLRSRSGGWDWEGFVVETGRKIARGRFLKHDGAVDREADRSWVPLRM